MAKIFPACSCVVNLGQGKYCVDTREYIGLRARISINSCLTGGDGRDR